MKILIISNNPLSASGSNGRTMLSMLNQFKKDEILNIFINGSDPSFDLANFYQINETNIIKNKKPFGTYVGKKNRFVQNTKYSSKKNAFKYMVRSFLWSKKSIKKEFLQVALTFNPDKIIIQCGDSDFLINISCWLSKKLNIPLVSYNSEDYLFKTWNYIEKIEKKSLSFKIFIKRLRKSYDYLYETGASFVYLTDSLKDLYLTKYPNHKAYVIFNSSNIMPINEYNSNGDIVYCGNIGVGRLKTLIFLSKEIYKRINKKIKVYSQIKEQKLSESINSCDTIEYMGSVSYAECINIQKNASFLLLIESFEDYYLKDTKNAFSTKIADSLAIGVPLIALVPKSSFVYKYLAFNNCAIVETSVFNIVNKIYNINQIELDVIVKNAIKLSNKNHNSAINSKMFYDILAS